MSCFAATAQFCISERRGLRFPSHQRNQKKKKKEHQGRKIPAYKDVMKMWTSAEFISLQKQTSKQRTSCESQQIVIGVERHQRVRATQTPESFSRVGWRSAVGSLAERLSSVKVSTPNQKSNQNTAVVVLRVTVVGTL